MTVHSQTEVNATAVGGSKSTLTLLSPLPQHRWDDGSTSGRPVGLAVGGWAPVSAGLRQGAGGGGGRGEEGWGEPAGILAVLGPGRQAGPSLSLLLQSATR